MTCYYTPMSQQQHMLLHYPDGRRGVADPEAIYYLEADGDDTLVRFRSKERIRDVRRLSQMQEIMESLGFVRIHRSYLVNTARVQEIRPRAEGRGWEVVLQPPVNRVLSISGDRLDKLLAAYF